MAISSKKKKKKYVQKGAIADNEPVSATVYGDTVEMSTTWGGTPVMQKVSKDKMVNRYTGEVVDIHHITSRVDPKNKESLRNTFKRLKRLIGANFSGGSSELWVTLTYAQPDGKPMTDNKRLYHDFKLFMKRLRKLVGKYLAYICVVEPQASGSLHCHCMMKTLDKSKLYVSNEDMADCWGQGFVNVRRLKNSDNAAAYVMAYLSDIDFNNLEGQPVDKKAPKKIIKGGRLGLYDVSMQIYRRSRHGIVEPTRIKGNAKKIKQKYGVDGVKADYFHSFDVERSDGIKKTIKTEYYSRKKTELKRAAAKIKDYKDLDSKKER